jgi:hypothetical protein
MTAAGLTSGRRTMLLVTALLALPFIVAFVLYWFEWRPAKLANHGQLIEPARALPETGLTLVDGRPLPTAELRRKWTLVMLAPNPCASACQQDLHQIRQVQVALNKEMVRLRRVLLGSSVADLRTDPALAEIQRSYPDLIIAAPSADESWRHLADDPRRRRLSLLRHRSARQRHDALYRQAGNARHAQGPGALAEVFMGRLGEKRPWPL